MEPRTFADLNISADIKKAISEFGHIELFPIQAQTIPKLLAGQDIVGQAQTGTGKTAAFAIPILERIDSNLLAIQALVLVPTRELAVQVCDEIKRIGKYKKARALAVYGGASIDKQIDILRRGVHVVVGTPGRLIDHIGRGTLRLSRVKILILDEADRMLDMGFIDDIKFILESTPRDRQTALFSATMPDAILTLAESYMKPHDVVAVSKDELTVKDTEQVYTEVNYFNKIATLKALISKEKIESAIIFCNTKVGVDKLAYTLKKMGYSVEATHGSLSQSRRNHVMADFRAGKIQFMIATDVAARGLDIKGVSHVINYNVPKDPKDYVHRIGRTGRAGKPGKAITFITERDAEAWGQVKWYINADIKKVDYGVPAGEMREREHRDTGSRNRRPHRRFEQGDRRGPDKYALGEF